MFFDINFYIRLLCVLNIDDRADVFVELTFFSWCVFFYSSIFDSKKKAKKQGIAHLMEWNKKPKSWLIIFLGFVLLGSRGVFIVRINKFFVWHKRALLVRFLLMELIFVKIGVEGLWELHKVEREKTLFDCILGGVVEFFFLRLLFIRRFNDWRRKKFV